MTIWLVRDRRDTKNKVVEAVVEGHIHSIYFNPDAAMAAKYATEKVWKIEIKATLK